MDTSLRKLIEPRKEQAFSRGTTQQSLKLTSNWRTEGFYPQNSSTNLRFSRAKGRLETHNLNLINRNQGGWRSAGRKNKPNVLQLRGGDGQSSLHWCLRVTNVCLTPGANLRVSTIFNKAPSLIIAGEGITRLTREKVGLNKSVKPYLFFINKILFKKNSFFFVILIILN